MLPFLVGLDNQILAPGMSVEQGGEKKKPPLVDAMQTAEVQNTTRMQMLQASIDLQHAQIFAELQMSVSQKSTARATRKQQAIY